MAAAAVWTAAPTVLAASAAACATCSITPGGSAVGCFRRLARARAISCSLLRSFTSAPRSRNQAAPGRSGRGVSERLDVVVHFLLGVLLLVAVALLELADELVLLAADQGPVVVRQLRPLRA